MRTIRIMTLAVLLLAAFSVTAFAAEYKEDDVYQGLSGIQPGDKLTLHKDTTDADLTAKWGVRVIFEKWDGTELKNKLVTVYSGIPGSTEAPAAPAREGYKFLEWERIDDSADATACIDGSDAVGITGPGPIIFRAKYEPIPEPTTAPSTTAPSTTAPSTTAPSGGGGGGGGGIVTPYPKGTTAAAPAVPESAQAAELIGTGDGENLDPFIMGVLNATGDRAPIGILAAALVILLCAFAAVNHNDKKKGRSRKRR